MIRHPLLASGQLRRLGRQTGTDRFAGCQPGQHILFPSPGNHGMGARGCSPFCCQNLGQHAAAADCTAGAAGHRFECDIAGPPFMHEQRIGIAAWVGRIKTLLVCQYDQCVGVDQVGHQRTKRVVVTELDFIGDHRIVLINDRHHAKLQQCKQRRARIQVAFAIRQVGMGQQYLGGAQVMG